MSAPNRRESNDVGDSESDNEDRRKQPTDSDAVERESGVPSTHGEIFKDNANHPINFFIHESVKKADTIRKLEADITSHGGRVVLDLKHALVVLVHRHYPSRKELQASYEAAQHVDLHKIFVKQTSFVMSCIERNRMHLYEEEIRPMRGFPPGGRRNEFTDEDDENLCHYLSRITPDKEAGGRLGYNVYKQLVRLGEVNPDHFGWATLHTYESWRGRYKNHKVRMDEMIEWMAEEDPPTHKQLWREDRRLNKQRGSRHVVVVSEEEMESTSEEGEREEKEGDNDEAIEQLKPVGIASVPKPQQGKRVQSVQSPKRSRRPSKRPRTLNSQSAKDKQRAIEEGEEEIVDLALYEVDFFDGQDFNGPEPTGRTLVPTQTQQPPTSSNFLTQRTLVPSTARNGELRNHGLPAPTSWPSPIQIPLNVQTNPVNTSTRSAPALIADSLSNQAQKQANEPGPAFPSPQGNPISLPTQPTGTAYQRPRMAARRPKGFLRTPAVDNSEPSQNTRSRTRQLPAVPATQSKKNIKEERIDDSEAERQSLFASPVVERVSETAGNNNIEHRQINQDAHGQRDEPEASTRMDSDDAETKRNLSGRSKASLSLDLDASEILQRLQSVRMEGSSRHSARLNSLLVSATPRHSLQTPNRALITPVPRQWSGGSHSSIETFPLSGTKASAMKKQLQQQEKRTPYKPPEGTRAATLAQQPRRL